MGSFIEINDTLQLTKEQGFPEILDLDKHTQNPLQADHFKEVIFEFHSKPKIRFYQAPPVRNFLVENRDGKWIYWGLVNVVETTHNHNNNTTAGKFVITYIYTPEEMKRAHELINRDSITKFFE